MGDVKDEDAVAYETLTKMGSKWAVLMSMVVTMSKRNVSLPPGLQEKLAMARAKIASGCFSCCEVSCALCEVESELSSKFHTLDDDEFKQFQDLLRDAMQGQLDYNRIISSPALAPVRNDCGF